PPNWICPSGSCGFYSVIYARRDSSRCMSPRRPRSRTTATYSRRLSMDSVRSDRGGDRAHIPVALKILIAGGFGAGKTTMVGSVSEIRPLQTEEVLSGGDYADDTHGVEGKT